jgi:hypothetical protein
MPKGALSSLIAPLNARKIVLALVQVKAEPKEDFTAIWVCSKLLPPSDRLHTTHVQKVNEH